MRKYRSYLLDAQFHIATAHVFTCEDDEHAIELSRDIFALTDGYRAVELWHSTRRVYLYPRDGFEVTENALSATG